MKLAMAAREELSVLRTHNSSEKLGLKQFGMLLAN